MPKEESVGFPELLKQLRITNRLLAAGLRSSMKQIQLISLLASTGASAKDIADVLDTTPATVNTTLQRLKKKGGNGNGKKGDSAEPTGSDL